MKYSTRLWAAVLLLPSGVHLASAQTLDPLFAPPSMYGPGAVLSAVEQPDGKRVIAGLFTRVDGTPAWAVSRFDANGALDAAFQQNIGSGGFGYRIRLLSNGQFLLLYPGNSLSPPLTLGGISRVAILRLNANGTGDASFNPGTGPSDYGFVDDVLPLPNGQVIAVGAFTSFNGVPTNGIVRLTSTGAVDATFNSGLGADATDDIERIIALPNGKFLASGSITRYNGVPVDDGVIRLNADGSLDPTFQCAFGGVVDNMLLQPDGRILITGGFGNSTSTFSISRLMPDGANDNSFTPPTFATYANSSRYGDPLQLQPDGKILVINGLPPTGSTSSVVRLNTDGTIDPTFQVGTPANSFPSSLLLLANGKRS